MDVAGGLSEFLLFCSVVHVVVHSLLSGRNQRKLIQMLCCLLFVSVTGWRDLTRV